MYNSKGESLSEEITRRRLYKKNARLLAQTLREIWALPVTIDRS